MSAVDSIYYSRPNICFYLGCDTCEYLRQNNIWKIKDADSLYFTSVDVSLNTVITIDGKQVKSSVSVQELQEDFENYQTKVVDWKLGKVFAITTTDNCELSFRFKDGKLQKVVYGLYVYQ